MKLQISFDMHDLEKALLIAEKVAQHADSLEVGTQLIYHYGIKAVEQFKERFGKKTIVADSKIVDRGKETTSLFGKAGSHWVTVMAGTSKDVIHTACSTAHSYNMFVMLDLLNACSLGQSALEAKNLGASALLFHQPHDDQESLTFLDKWDMIKENTTLPIFISGKIKRETIDEIVKLKPAGIIIGKSIVEADDPAQEAQYYKDICSKN